MKSEQLRDSVALDIWSRTLFVSRWEPESRRCGEGRRRTRGVDESLGTNLTKDKADRSPDPGAPVIYDGLTIPAGNAN